MPRKWNPSWRINPTVLPIELRLIPDPMVPSSASIRLHSQFDPSGEAARYLGDSLGDRRPSCVLILGGGEDWLSEAARKRLPGSLIVSLQFDPSFRGLERPGADLRWYPDSGALYGFLARAIPERLDGGVAVVGWKPSERAFPRTAAEVYRDVRQALEEFTSDAATIRFWSRRWMENALRNFMSAERYCLVRRADDPIVVAAAGPSLEPALEALSPYRGRFRLWALASAAGACLRRGWIPELVASTDPGFWAERHFDPMLRDSPSAGIPLASHLTARIPRRILEKSPLILLAPREAPENDLSEAAGLAALPSPSRGTSASDALSLADSYSGSSVIAAGLDLGSRDLRSHCRPYGFDIQVLKPERRLKPGLSLLWERETSAFPERRDGWRRGRSFDLYAGGLLPGGHPPIRRLLPSPVPVGGTIPLESTELKTVIPPVPGASDSRFETIDAPPVSRRSAIADSVLGSWLDEAEAALAGRTGAPLASRARRLLYALGGSEAAAFLAETARGVHEAGMAEHAAAAVRRSVSKLRELMA